MLVTTAVALAPATGRAHALRLSRGEWSMGQGRVEAHLTFLREELLLLAAEKVDEGTAERAALERVVVSDVRVAGQRCELQESGLHSVEGDGSRIDLRWRCPPSGALWTVQLPFLSELSPGHTHLARVTAEGQTVERVARGSLPSFEVEARPSVFHALGRFFRLGVEHIFTGYDHLAFLLGLLLLGGTVSQLAGIVSSFTLAHSVTLTVAALGLVSLPSAVVEPAIAASVVAVAAENLWALRRSADSPARVAEAIGRRWRLTFCFGLVHGFGFANALRELELPRAALAAGLVSFNLGVETGQLLLVLATVPLLRALGRLSGAGRPGAPALSWSIAGLGLVWFGQRIAGLG
ncbi:MAG: HupE/UreJ family protein [Myxococcaceae bacterium]